MSQTEFINGLDIMKYHNHQIYAHSIRVADLAIYIGKECGLVGFDLVSLYFSAFFHDIGKIDITPEIIYKPGILTESEWVVMKGHPLKGKETLEARMFISNTEILNAVLFHHEKYDGSGYPNKLKGEDIPFLSRIIIVADAIEAMVSYRSYKQPYSLDRALSELLDCAGGQFDPYIVKDAEKWSKEKLESIVYASLAKNQKNRRISNVY